MKNMPTTVGENYTSMILSLVSEIYMDCYNTELEGILILISASTFEIFVVSQDYWIQPFFIICKHQSQRKSQIPHLDQAEQLEN